MHARYLLGLSLLRRSLLLLLLLGRSGGVDGTVWGRSGCIRRGRSRFFLPAPLESHFPHAEPLLVPALVVPLLLLLLLHGLPPVVPSSLVLMLGVAVLRQEFP